MQVGSKVVVIHPLSAFWSNIGTVVRIEDTMRGDYLTMVVVLNNQPDMLKGKHVKFSPYELA